MPAGDDAFDTTSAGLTVFPSREDAAVSFETVCDDTICALEEAELAVTRSSTFIKSGDIVQRSMFTFSCVFGGTDLAAFPPELDTVA